MDALKQFVHTPICGPGMSFLRIRTITTLAVSATAVLALPAGTAVAKSAVKYPVITKVTPMKVGVGDLLTIKGKGFRAGKNKNTVVFKRSGQRAVFVKAEVATTTAITLHVPLKLQAYMQLTDNQPVPSVFAIRIIAKRFGQKFTPRKLSPTVGPAGTGITPPGVTPPSLYEQCLATAQANPSGDEDKDSLTNALEKSVGTDPCRVDTDTDGMADGWEYQSAIDLNSRALPYPGKKPWPNPLDPTDLNSDFDGDGLKAWQEFAAWQYVGGTFLPDGTIGAYSDGTQNTGGPVPTAGNSALQRLDQNSDGNLTDDDRDADNDGLSNMVEFNNEGTQKYWVDRYKEEKPYIARLFAEPNPLDPDSDGDGVLDGADDQDVDGYDNFTEMELARDRSALFVNPYNPCLPDPYSITCSRWVPLDPSARWPPFDEKSQPWLNSVVPLTWGSPTAPLSGQTFWNGGQGQQGPDVNTTTP
jgi:hypothetical protein